jgi:hypothetical protein
MKKTYEKVRTKFARNVRFNVDPIPFRATENTQLENLKTRLLREHLELAVGVAQNVALRRAAGDAAALAWATQYPLLLFPVLLEEKARVALTQCMRQEQIRQATLNLLPEAA